MGSRSSSACEVCFTTRGAAGRRGSAYVLVLAATLLVAVITYGALAAVRLQRRASAGTQDAARARELAAAAIEIGRARIAANANWRSDYGSGDWIMDLPLGGGLVYLEGHDPSDADVTNRVQDPLVLTATGLYGVARYQMTATLTARYEALAVLASAVHADRGAGVANWHSSLTLSGGPLTSNANVTNNLGTINGDVAAKFVFNLGVINGTVTEGTKDLPMPAGTVVQEYIDRATAIPFSGDINRRLISPASNPWGATNSQGVYFLDAGSASLKIRNTRVLGTLIVRTTGGLTIDGPVLMQNYNAEYPALIIDGDAWIVLDNAVSLTETAAKRNLNPAGTPYEGVTDTDQTDQYPNELRGLIHVTGDLELAWTTRVSGALLVGGFVTVWDSPQITHDATLLTKPPLGYTEPITMTLQPGTWKRVVQQ